MIALRFIRVHILPVLAEHRALAALSMALLFMTTAGMLLTVELSRQLLALLTAGEDGERITWGARLARSLGAESPAGEVAMLGAIAVLTGAIVYTGIFLRDRGFESLAIAVTRVLREQIYGRILAAPYLAAVHLSVGTTVKRIVHDTLVVRDLVVDALLARTADLVLLLAFTAYLAVLNPLLTVGVALMITGYVYVSMWTAQRARFAMRRASDRMENLTDTAQDGLGRLTDIRALGREGTERDRFARATRLDAEARMTMVSWLMLDRSLTTFLSWLGPFAILSGGGIMTMRGTLPVETLLVFVVVLGLLYNSVNNLTALPMKLQRTRVAIENLVQLQSLTADAAHEAERARPELRPHERRPAIETLALRYAYPDSQIDLQIPACTIDTGGLVAVVGASGAGKSTFFRLVMGLLPDYSGSLRVCGHEAREAGIERLRDFAGFLQQESSLFPGTVAANIAYGARPDQQVGEDDVEAAAAAAGLTPDLRQWSDRLDQEIASLGADLSGGQRRRIALARLLLRDPKLLLLDEPLSGVGRGDRQLILEAIHARRGRSTILIATHDTDVIEAADAILVLERIEAENGTVTTFGSMGTLSELSSSSRALQSALGTQQVTATGRLAG